MNYILLWGHTVGHTDIKQGFPSGYVFQDSPGPPNEFFKVQWQKSSVLNPEIFLLHIQFKNQNCLNVQCDSHLTEYFPDFIFSIRILLFLFIFLFYSEGLRGLPRFLLGSPRQHFGSLRLSILRQGKP